MVSFISVHRGASAREAKVVAVSTDPLLVADVATRLLQDDQADNQPDPVLAALDQGRTRALRLIQLEGNDHAY